MSETQKQFVEIVEDLTELRKAKSTAYGDGFIKNYNKYGSQAAFFDLLRKWQRIETLLYAGGENKVSDETVDDTLGDMAVMCINIMIWRRQNGNATKRTNV